MLKRLLPFFLLLTASLSALAQTESAAKRFHRHGNWFYKKDDFLKALPFLVEAVNSDPHEALYAWKAGRSLFESGQIKEALPFLVRAYNLDRNIPAADRVLKKSPTSLDYYLGRTLHMLGQFEAAKVHFQAELGRLSADDPLFAETQMLLNQCNHGPLTSTLTSPYQAKNMGQFVNSRFPEYAATFADNYGYMVFTSRRPRKASQRAFHFFYPQDINEEVYEAQWVEGEWMKSHLFSKPIPVFRNDASIAISEDGKSLIFYDDKNDGDIFVSVNQNGIWSQRQSIGSRINTESNEPSAFITNMGQTLYYVSDKPGGLGGKDLYVSQIQGDGSWGEGQNLGNEINTPYDEDAPFITPDGKQFYFSSRGHNSMGGYDIFRSDLLPNGSWSSPINLGTPFNSPGEDIYFLSTPDGKRFFFSSNRPGGFGDMDLYEAVPAEIDENPTMVSGQVLDKLTGTPVLAEVQLLESGTGAIVETQTTGKKGNYSFSIPKCGEEYHLDVRVITNENPSSPAPTLGAPNLLSGTVIDAVTGNPLQAQVEVIDGLSGKTVETLTTNPLTGNYFVPVTSGMDYQLRITSPNYLTYVEEFHVDPTGAIEAHTLESALQKTIPGSLLVITWQFFDVDKANLKTQFHQDLDNLAEAMHKAPDLKLLLTGHTDSDGDEVYNQDLSRKRAEAVKQYLVKKGIAESRLKTEGKGESEPIYENIGEKKSWNRRVEITVMD